MKETRPGLTGQTFLYCAQVHCSLQHRRVKYQNQNRPAAGQRELDVQTHLRCCQHTATWSAAEAQASWIDYLAPSLPASTVQHRQTKPGLIDIWTITTMHQVHEILPEN